MRTLRQIFALTASSLSGLGQRIETTTVTIVCIVTVVAVLLAMLSTGEGARVWYSANARADRAVVMSSGASTGAQSNLPRDTLAKTAQASGVRRSPAGDALVSGQAVLSVDVLTRTGERTNMFIIGITNRAVLPELRILEGRWYQPGLHELVVSRTAQSLFEGVHLGDPIPLRGGDWRIVGVFDSIGGAADQSFYSDAETLLSAFGRDTYQQILAVLESPAAFERFKAALSADPTVHLDVLTEIDNRRNNLRSIHDLLDFLGYFIGGLLAAGAVCAAVCSMYAMVDARRQEIATLRAIGFGAMPVVASVLLEGVLLAIIASIIGVLVAWTFFNGKTVTTQSLTFPLAVNGRLIAISILWALAIGFLGGLLPALRATRLSVASALRAT